MLVYVRAHVCGIPITMKIIDNTSKLWRTANSQWCISVVLKIIVTKCMPHAYHFATAPCHSRESLSRHSWHPGISFEQLSEHSPGEQITIHIKIKVWVVLKGSMMILSFPLSFPHIIIIILVLILLEICKISYMDAFWLWWASIFVDSTQPDSKGSRPSLVVCCNSSHRSSTSFNFSVIAAATDCVCYNSIYGQQLQINFVALPSTQDIVLIFIQLGCGSIVHVWRVR